jgi:hypothetical protein
MATGSLAMAGAWHPLVAHPVGALAVEVLGGGFSLSFCGEYRLLCPLAGLLSAGGSGVKAGNESANGSKRGEDLSVVCHAGITSPSVSVTPGLI